MIPIFDTDLNLASLLSVVRSVVPGVPGYLGTRVTQVAFFARTASRRRGINTYGSVGSTKFSRYRGPGPRFVSVSDYGKLVDLQ